jgi:transcriptional regulator with XRE-family HTH domain
MKKPARPCPTPTGRHTLSYQLRELIEARGLSAYAVGQLAGVDPGVVQRFVTGRRDVLMGTADRIAAALGLRLVEVARKGRPPGRAATSATTVSVEPPADGPPPT